MKEVPFAWCFLFLFPEWLTRGFQRLWPLEKKKFSILLWSRLYSPSSPLKLKIMWASCSSVSRSQRPRNSRGGKWIWETWAKERKSQNSSIHATSIPDGSPGLEEKIGFRRDEENWIFDNRDGGGEVEWVGWEVARFSLEGGRKPANHHLSLLQKTLFWISLEFISRSRSNYFQHPPLNLQPKIRPASPPADHPLSLPTS